MNTNEITLDENNTAEEYAAILKGRYVTNITTADDEIRTTTLTLDNGNTLTIEGNEGCSGCGINGWYHVEQAYLRGNKTARIMNAHVKYEWDEDAEMRETYTIFVMVEGNTSQLPLATLRGDDGPGGYGTGFTLTVRPASCDHSGDA